MFGWILQQIIGDIPGWIWPMIAGSGFAVYMFGGFLNGFPPLKPYIFVIRISSVVVCAGGLFLWGGAGVMAVYQAQIQEMENKVAIAEQQSQTANAKIETKIVTQTKIIHDSQVVIKEKIIKDSAKIDAECKLAPETISDLNAAALNPLKAGAK
jgi:hypothetical protein